MDNRKSVRRNEETKMLSRDEEIEIYTENKFSPEAAAQNFFASYSEAEISKRLNDLSMLQSSIEDILKEKVRQNYQVFLQANYEVDSLGKDVDELNNLVKSNQHLVEDMRNICLDETKRLAPLTSSKSDSCKTSRSPKITRKATTIIPKWIIDSSREVRRMIIEQQYAAAVDLVTKFSVYVSRLDDRQDPTLRKAVEAMNGASLILAKNITYSMKYVPDCELWGEDEQMRRLKWLVILGHKKMAASSFSKYQPDLTAKTFSVVDASGDTMNYVKEICQAFFLMLSKRVTLFQTLMSYDHLELNLLLSNNKDEVVLMSSILDWIQSQLKTFIDTLCRQIQIGVNESSAMSIVQLRSCLISSKGTKPSAKSMSSPNAQLTEENISQIPNKKMLELSKAQISASPLEFLGKSICHLLRNSRLYVDCLGINASSMIRLMLSPELIRFVQIHVLEIQKEANAQIHQDSFSGIMPFTLFIRNDQMSSLSSDYQNKLQSLGVSVSLHWFLSAINFFIDECQYLLSIDVESLSNNDVCENLERTRNELVFQISLVEIQYCLVQSILSLVTSFAVELLTVDYLLLSQSQRECYAFSLQVFSDLTLSSLKARLYYFVNVDQGALSSSDVITNIQQEIGSHLHKISSSFTS